MKFTNKLIAAVMALPVLAGLTACSDEHAEYAAASQLKSAQVYFPTTSPDVNELDMNGTTYDVVVARVKTEGEMTVAIKAEQDEDKLFTIPQAVTFADGASTAKLTITYDPSKMEYDDMRVITLSVADAEITTPYGNSTYTAKYGVPAPWTEWCRTPKQFADQGIQGVKFPLGDKGTGNYYYDQMFGGVDKGLPVYFRMSTIDPTVGQFKLGDENLPWGYGVELIIDAKWNEDNGVWLLSIAEQASGYYASNYSEDVMIADLATYQGIEMGTDDWYGFASFYDPEMGTFKLTVIYYISLGYFGYGLETLQMDGFYVPDYSAELEYSGVLTDKKGNTFACAALTLGKDAEKAYAMVVSSDNDPAAVADALAAGEGVEVTAGNIQVPFNAEELNANKLSLVVAVPGENGAAGYAVANFEYFGAGNASPWKSLGIGLYNEGIISDMYSLDQLTYEVEILENKEQPGLYRIMDPYGAAWENAVYNALTPCEYLEVNACDPEGVYILPQMLGVGLRTEDGVEPEIGFASYGGYFLSTGEYTFQQLKEDYDVMGIVKDNHIMFPVFATGQDPTAKDYYTFQGMVYYANKIYNGGMGVEIVLPGAASKAKVKAASSAYNRTMQRLRHVRSIRSSRQELKNKSHLPMHILCKKLNNEPIQPIK